MARNVMVTVAESQRAGRKKDEKIAKSEDSRSRGRVVSTFSSTSIEQSSMDSLDMINTTQHAMAETDSPTANTTSNQQGEQCTGDSFEPNCLDGNLNEQSTISLPEFAGYAPLPIAIPVLKSHPTAEAMEYYKTLANSQNSLPFGYYLQSEDGGGLQWYNPAEQLIIPHSQELAVQLQECYEEVQNERVDEEEQQQVQKEPVDTEQVQQQVKEGIEQGQEDGVQKDQVIEEVQQQVQKGPVDTEQVEQQVKEDGVQKERFDKKGQQQEQKESVETEQVQQQVKEGMGQGQENGMQKDQVQDDCAQHTQAHADETSESLANITPVHAMPAQKAEEIFVQKDIVHDAPSQIAQLSSELMSSSLDDFDLEELFAGGNSVVLPGLGVLTHSDYIQNKAEYDSVVSNDQKKAFASIKQLSGHIETTDEKFQSVPKNMSFDQGNLSDKAKEALRSAIIEFKRSKAAAKEQQKMLGKTAPSAIGKAESDSVKMQPESGHDDSEQVQSGKSSSQAIHVQEDRAQEIRAQELRGKPDQSMTPKKEKKNKEKKTKVSDKNDENEFGQAAIYNMNIQLKTYFYLRKTARKDKRVPLDQKNEPPLYTFEKNLIKHARDLQGEPDVKLKDEFCRQVLSDLPTMEMDEPVYRQDLIQLFLLLAKRNDEILVIDCAFLQAEMTKQTPAEVLTSYLRLCCRDTIVDMVNMYFKMRASSVRNKFIPETRENESNSTMLEKLLIFKAVRASFEFSEYDYTFKTTVVNIILHRLQTWPIPEEQRAHLIVFYSHLANCNDAIWIQDVKTLSAMLKQPNPHEYFIYYEEYMSNRLF